MRYPCIPQKKQFPPKCAVVHCSQTYKFVPYKARQHLYSSKFRNRGRRPRMAQNTNRRRAFLVIFLLSFIPYLLPEHEKPPIYRSKTNEEMNKLKRDRFIGGKIDNLPFY